MLYPPPPRKQPDVWRGLGAPHGMGVRRTVSNEGSQGSRKTEPSTRTKPSLFGPTGTEGVRSGTPVTRTAFYFHKTDVCPAALLPVSSRRPVSATTSRTGTVIRRGPAPRPVLRWPLELLGLQSTEADTHTTGQLSAEEQGKLHTPPSLVFSSVPFFFKLPALGGD